MGMGQRLIHKLFTAFSATCWGTRLIFSEYVHMLLMLDTRKLNPMHTEFMTHSFLIHFLERSYRSRDQVKKCQKNIQNHRKVRTTLSKFYLTYVTSHQIKMPLSSNKSHTFSITPENLIRIDSSAKKSIKCSTSLLSIMLLRKALLWPTQNTLDTHIRNIYFFDYNKT
ncbi:hypothetical protein Bhyg_04836 [Pseudolycoriella hygida]|uniref:Uncharacterized protein n=1 Tax=Pseudolycoriella hygida TaxID=35572 RepID=A0A9Q0S9W8_9DIPT|nr:hypothetical protein Bhyg_04836 [Pseudolycoriella hygida]